MMVTTRMMTIGSTITVTITMTRVITRQTVSMTMETMVTMAFEGFTVMMPVMFMATMCLCRTVQVCGGLVSWFKHVETLDIPRYLAGGSLNPEPQTLNPKSLNPSTPQPPTPVNPKQGAAFRPATRGIRRSWDPKA